MTAADHLAFAKAHMDAGSEHQSAAGAHLQAAHDLTAGDLDSGVGGSDVAPDTGSAADQLAAVSAQGRARVPGGYGAQKSFDAIRGH